MADEIEKEPIGLHNLKPAPGSRRPRKRVGRGEGSGLGKTSGRGQKGAGSRSGAKDRARFEGGQMPIHMRMRKLRGPHMKKSMPFEMFRTSTQGVNVQDLEARFDKGAEVTLDALKAAGLAKKATFRSRSSPRARSPSRSPSTRTSSARRPRRPSRPPAAPPSPSSPSRSGNTTRRLRGPRATGALGRRLPSSPSCSRPS